MAQGLACFASFAGGIAAMYVYDQFKEHVQAARLAGETSHELQRLTERAFGGLFPFSWSAGLAHLADTYGIHSKGLASNLIASVELAAAIPTTVDWLGEAFYTAEPPGPLDVSTHIVAVGSPISDRLSREILEYHGPNRYSLTRYGTPRIDLPFTYVLSEAELGNYRAIARRYVGGEEREMPNWLIRHRGQLLQPPKLDRNGWLNSDYLLISRLPNFLTQQGLSSGSEALIVGGTHGVGTASIGLLLKSPKHLLLLDEGRRGSRFFQALISVDRIDHRRKGSFLVSEGVELGQIVVEPLPIDFSTLRAPHLPAQRI